MDPVLPSGVMLLERAAHRRTLSVTKRWARLLAPLATVRLLAALVVGIAILGGTASAQSIHAAALVPQIKRGGAAPELRDRFHDAVVRGLGPLSGPSGPAGELGEVLTAADARTRLGDELSTCGGEASCLQRALQALRVNRLIATDLVINGKSYIVTMRLYDGQGHELTHAEDLCEICNVREADELITKAAARVAAAARVFPVEVVVTPEREKPKPVVAPLVRDEPPQTSRVSPMQEPPPPPPPERVVTYRRRSGFPWRPLGFASFGAGLLGLAIGVPLIVIDGRPTCDAVDAVHQCPQVYNTRGGGAAAVTLGVLGLVAAVPLLYYDHRDRHTVVSSLQLGGGALAGGAHVSLQGHF